MIPGKVLPGILEIQGVRISKIKTILPSITSSATDYLLFATCCKIGGREPAGDFPLNI
jgi:hypothetical protein